jgi:putative ATPase
MKDLDYGKGYHYSHDYPNNFIAQEFLPQEVAGETLYKPGSNGIEEKQRQRLKALWKENYGY